MFKTILNRKYRVMLPLLLIGLAVIFSSGIQSVSADQSQIYVNTAGNDSYNGESQVFVSGIIGPKKTIIKAVPYPILQPLEPFSSTGLLVTLQL